MSPTSTVVSNVVTYNVTIQLTKPPSTVKSGMTANVSVIVASATNVLELPTSAVTTTGRISTVTLLEERQADDADRHDRPGRRHHHPDQSPDYRPATSWSSRP